MARGANQATLLPMSSGALTGSPAVPTDFAAGERVRLRDGSTIEIRRAAAGDEPELRSFLGDLCLEARHLRFFSAAVDLDSAAHWASEIGEDRCGLLAHDERGLLVGHASFIQIDGVRAEVAVEVADRLHGDGLGTMLIERLAAIAEVQGVTEFVAEVMPENRSMLEVFCRGFDAHVRLRDGTDTVEFPTATWRLASERFGAGSER
jgi:L-amino acid N-acyltransferase YncA